MKTLFDVYKKPSQAKINAWNEIALEMINRGGYGLHIVSHNYHFFTCAYYCDTPVGKLKITHTPCKQKIEFVK